MTHLPGLASVFVTLISDSRLGTNLIHEKKCAISR